MPALFGKTTHDELAAFLKRHGQRWTVEGNAAFQECVDHLPMETDELIGAMRRFAPGEDDVYLVSDIFPASQVGDFFSHDEAKPAKSADLNEFVIRAVRGSDFLYVFCSPEDVSNGSCITICRAAEES